MEPRTGVCDPISEGWRDTRDLPVAPSYGRTRLGRVAWPRCRGPHALPLAVTVTGDASRKKNPALGKRNSAQKASSLVRPDPAEQPVGPQRAVRVPHPGLSPFPSSRACLRGWVWDTP